MISRYHNSNWRPFNKGPLREYIAQISEDITGEIDNYKDDFILNANEEQLLEYIESRYILDAPILHFDQVTVDSYEAIVPVEYFHSHISRFRQDMAGYQKTIIQYFVPISGDSSLLEYHPSTFSIGGGSNASLKINGDNLVIDIINFNNNGDDIKRELDSTEKYINQNYKTLLNDIKSFNNRLKSEIRELFISRKQVLLQQKNLLASLGVPLKKQLGVSATFTIPKPALKEKLVIKPIVNEKGFKPEPTLDLESYNHILRLINDLGKNLERMPSTYSGKGEEDLRDHFILVLDPNFQLGNATGETFNKSGKTDIQLRYDSSVVFIAECKFWSGPKGYLESIDQLLGYLTWRDTKAAVIIFVKQKDISTILGKIKSETPNHANYLGFVGNSDENWFNYRFHINGDKNREVKLAVMVYHLPT